MRVILTSPEFSVAGGVSREGEDAVRVRRQRAPRHRRDVRDALPLVRALQQLGMPLYQCQPPTGYKDTADAWVNTGALVNRMNFALRARGGRMRGVRCRRHAGGSRALAARPRRDVDAAWRRSRKRRTAPQMIALAIGAPEFQRIESATDAAGRSAAATLGVAGIPELTARKEIVMISRRVFLKNGALALVSLGFAPSFLARTASRGRHARAEAAIAIFQRGAVDGLNMVVPFGEPDYYRARPSIAIAAAGRGDDGGVDLDGFFGLHPALAPLKPLWDRAPARDRARLRIARQHALALRRAGLHGDRHARREEHARRLAESLPAGARSTRRQRRSAPSR